MAEQIPVTTKQPQAPQDAIAPEVVAPIEDAPLAEAAPAEPEPTAPAATAPVVEPVAPKPLPAEIAAVVSQRERERRPDTEAWLHGEIH